MALSMESRALRRSCEAFTSGVDPEFIITNLYAKFLLTQGEKERATQRTLTPRQQLGVVFECLERRVAVDPSVFHQLVQVLLMEPTHTLVGRKMQAYYDEGQSQRPSLGISDTASPPPPETLPFPPPTSTSWPEQQAPHSSSSMPSPSLTSPLDPNAVATHAQLNNPRPIPSTSGTKTSRPTLPLLLHLPVGADRHINLAEVIGNKFEFGVHLLNDEDGYKTSNIRSQERGSVKDINREIMMSWLQGYGKPVTWESLVGVLRSMELYSLATDVENAARSLQKQESDSCA